MITKIEEEYMGKIETINCINKPKVVTGSFTSYDYCPSCMYEGLFRVYWPYREYTNKYSCIGVYESMCPRCHAMFDIVDITEILVDTDN